MRDDPPLTPDLLLQAYRVGVFPMSESRDSEEVFWVDPRQRGILPLDAFHISRSLRKALRSGHFQTTLNQDFEAILQGCAARSETWINDTIFGLYTQLHRRGHAHSCEVWHDGKLAGGVYGVAIGGAFFGESMFSNETNGSKTALAALTTHLRHRGFTLFDTQFLTPHLATLGAIEVSREVYHGLLDAALVAPATMGPPGPLPLP